MLDITKYRRSTTRLKGVYLLMKKKEVIYVGMSNDIYLRILEHQSMGKDFDDVFVAEVDREGEEVRRALEMSIICEYMPTHNKIKFDNFYNWFHSFPFCIDYESLMELKDEVIEVLNKDLGKDGLLLDIHQNEYDALFAKELNTSMPTI